MTAFSIRSNCADRRIARIEIGRILPSPAQARRSFDEAQLHALAESIQEFGLIAPLLVCRTGGGNYELIAGERRLRAMKLLGWSHADAIVSAACGRDRALIGLIENLQRENLHFLDEAEACRRMLINHGISRDELAATLGKSQSALANLLRLLRLGGAAKACIREGGLSERHARALLRLEDEQMQIELARQAAREQLSVRQLEAIIDQQLKKQPRQKKASGMLPSGLIRDNRLVINALKDTVRQLKRIGVAASSRVETHDDYLDIIVTIRTPENEK